jgi:hypothetical protein
MKFPPYVGITGFMKRREIETLLENVDPELFGNRRQLMVGVLVSSKTLDGIPNKWTGSYPRIDEIQDIFLDSPYCCNLIHFSTDRPGQLGEDMIKLAQIGGKNCHGIQLNVEWPNVSAIKYFKSLNPQKRVVLQLKKAALEKAAWSLEGFKQNLYPYIEASGDDIKPIDDLLYDPSGGKGRFNWAPGEVIHFFEVLKAVIGQETGLGFAGGLCAERLPSYQFLIDEFKNILSIDVQGAIRTPLDQPYTNSMNLYKAYAYLIGALAMFYPGLYTPSTP